MDKPLIDKRYWDDMKWAREHYSELLAQYPNQWVAIYNQRVVAHGKSGTVVEQEAEQVTGQPESEIPVCYVDSGDTIYAG